MTIRSATACLTLFSIFLLVSAACAGDMIKPFTFKTIDGKVLDSRALAGRPVVINIGSHW